MSKKGTNTLAYLSGASVMKNILIALPPPLDLSVVIVFNKLTWANLIKLFW